MAVLLHLFGVISPSLLLLRLLGGGGGGGCVSRNPVEKVSKAQGRRASLSEGRAGSASRTAILEVGERLKTSLRAGVGARVAVMNA